jgi:hypothetical protein
MADETIASRALAIFTNRSLSPRDRTAGFIDNMVKDPEAWVTGNDPATAAQLMYLNTLATAQAGVGDEESQRVVAAIADMRGSGQITMSKSEASQRIGGYREQLGMDARP